MSRVRRRDGREKGDKTYDYLYSKYNINHLYFEYLSNSLTPHTRVYIYNIYSDLYT